MNNLLLDKPSYKENFGTKYTKTCKIYHFYLEIYRLRQAIWLFLLVCVINSIFCAGYGNLFHPSPVVDHWWLFMMGSAFFKLGFQLNPPMIIQLQWLLMQALCFKDHFAGMQWDLGNVRIILISSRMWLFYILSSNYALLSKWQI